MLCKYCKANCLLCIFNLFIFGGIFRVLSYELKDVYSFCSSFSRLKYLTLHNTFNHLSPQENNLLPILFYKKKASNVWLLAFEKKTKQNISLIEVYRFKNHHSCGGVRQLTVLHPLFVEKLDWQIFQNLREKSEPIVWIC